MLYLPTLLTYATESSLNFSLLFLCLYRLAITYRFTYVNISAFCDLRTRFIEIEEVYTRAESPGIQLSVYNSTYNKYVLFYFLKWFCVLRLVFGRFGNIPAVAPLRVIRY